MSRQPIRQVVLDLSVYAILIFGLVFILSLFVGCTGGAPGAVAPPPPPRFQLTLSGTIDGHAFQGIALGSEAPSHDIQISSATDVNVLIFDSCHRWKKFEDVIKTGWFKQNRGFQYQYDQSPGIEDTGDCLLRVCAFTKQVDAPQACGVFDFKSLKYTMPVENICDGENGQASGTSICHSRVGHVERLKFPGSVIVAPPPDPSTKDLIKRQCQGSFLDADQTTFEYVIPTDECTLIFLERAKPHRRSKHTVIPFDHFQYSLGGTA